MKAATRTLILSVIAGTALLVPAGGSASWWGSNDHDYWDGPWGYPGYGGWGGAPRIIYKVPTESSAPPARRIE
jgi:hypothetical protein